MAFNGYKLNYPTHKIVVNNDNHEVNSILSDDQSSWVLFNPESDVLSSSYRLSECLGVNYEQDEDYQDTDADDGEDQYHTELIEQPSAEEDADEEDADEEEDDDLIDNLNPTQKRLEQLFSKAYNPIKFWNLNNDIIDDNLASWDLDENLSINQLDTSILNQSFYGDELLNNLSLHDRKKFKKIQNNLKHYLNRRPNALMDQLLLKTLPLSQQLQLNQVTNKKMFNYHKNLIDVDETSTASSSLVMVGGKD